MNIKVVVNGQRFCSCSGVDQLARVLQALGQTDLYTKTPNVRTEGSDEAGWTLFIEQVDV